MSVTQVKNPTAQNNVDHLWHFSNEGISAASFCHQMAALVPDIFCNFYIVKNHKIANNSATTEAREKNKDIFGILRILENF